MILSIVDILPVRRLLTVGLTTLFATAGANSKQSPSHSGERETRETSHPCILLLFSALKLIRTRAQRKPEKIASNASVFRLRWPQRQNSAHLCSHDLRHTVHGEVEFNARISQERSLWGLEAEILVDRRVVHKSLVPPHNRGPADGMGNRGPGGGGDINFTLRNKPRLHNTLRRGMYAREIAGGASIYMQPLVLLLSAATNSDYGTNDNITHCTSTRKAVDNAASQQLTPPTTNDSITHCTSTCK